MVSVRQQSVVMAAIAFVFVTIRALRETSGILHLSEPLRTRCCPQAWHERPGCSQCRRPVVVG